MPQKKPGYHDIHIRVQTSDFRLLQQYCTDGIERITATTIINAFFNFYIQEHVKPRMKRGESATHAVLRKDIPVATALVAQQMKAKKN